MKLTEQFEAYDQDATSVYTSDHAIAFAQLRPQLVQKLQDADRLIERLARIDREIGSIGPGALFQLVFEARRLTA